MDITTNEQMERRRNHFFKQKVDAIRNSKRLSRLWAYEVLTGDGDYIAGFDDGEGPKQYND